MDLLTYQTFEPLTDIQKKQYEKDIARKKIYERIIEKCYYKINTTAENENDESLTYFQKLAEE